MSAALCYREIDWKYQAANDNSTDRAVLGGLAYSDKFLEYSPKGVLTLFAGYACDGPSVPGGFLHRPWNMRAAFFHDGHHQLARLGKFPKKRHRLAADLLFLAMMREDIDRLHDAIDYSKRNWLTRPIAKAYNAAERQAQRATALAMYGAVRAFGDRYWQPKPPAPVHCTP